MTERPDSAIIITFKDATANILHESYQAQMEDNEDDEIKSEMNQMGKMIGTIIKEQATAEYFYPCAGDINLQQLQEQVPDIIKSLVTIMFSPSSSDNVKLKKQLLQTSICHILMQVVSNQGYISPLMLSVGIFIHQTARSLFGHRLVLVLHMLK